MPTYYDPINYKKLQVMAEDFYSANKVDHFAPLKSLSPFNLRDLDSTSPVKILKYGFRALKIYRKLSPFYKKKKSQSWLSEESDRFYNMDNTTGKAIRKGNGESGIHSAWDDDNVRALEEKNDQFGEIDQTTPKVLRADRHGKYAKHSTNLQINGIVGTPAYTDYEAAAAGSTGIKIYLLSGAASGQLTPYLEIPYVPKDVEIKTNSTFAKINILNRNNVPYQFINGSEEITFTIDWYDPGRHLGRAHKNAKKMQLLTLMDGSKFPHKIFFSWGDKQPLFEGLTFYVKSAKMRMYQFHRARPDSNLANIAAVKGLQLPARVEQEITLIRVEKAGYWTHQDELNRIKTY